MRHLLQPGPDDHTAHVAHGAHHLQLLVDHHGELLGLLAVAEEGQQALGGRPPGRVAVGPADRVHHDGPAGHPHMDLRTRADQGPSARRTLRRGAAAARVHDERPVRPALGGQEPAEQRQRVGPAEAGDLAAEGPPDHEVRALAPPDLVLDDPPDDVRVLLVRDVEGAVLDPHVVAGQAREHLVQRQFVHLVGDQHRERGAVVAYVETTLGDLPEGHQGQRGQPAHRDVGEPGHLPYLAGQDLDGVVVAAGRAPAQQREGRGVVTEQGGQHIDGTAGTVSMVGRGHGLGHGRSFLMEERLPAPERREGRPSGGLREVCTRDESAGRRMSGPPPVPRRLREHARTLADAVDSGARTSARLIC